MEPRQAARAAGLARCSGGMRRPRLLEAQGAWWEGRGRACRLAGSKARGAQSQVRAWWGTADAAGPRANSIPGHGRFIGRCRPVRVPARAAERGAEQCGCLALGLSDAGGLGTRAAAGPAQGARPRGAADRWKGPPQVLPASYPWGGRCAAEAAGANPLYGGAKCGWVPNTKVPPKPTPWAACTHHRPCAGQVPRLGRRAAGGQGGCVCGPGPWGCCGSSGAHRQARGQASGRRRSSSLTEKGGQTTRALVCVCVRVLIFMEFSRG